MNVLVCCEESGVVRDAFRELGHEAWSCDLEGVEPRGKWPNYHLYGDCRLFFHYFGWRWDLIIAHPPCDNLANCSAKWLYHGGRKENGEDPDRWKAMWKDAAFYCDMLEAPADRICVENPIMLGYARDFIDGFNTRKTVRQIVQPWQFGHGEQKATVLELFNLPPLVPTNIVEGREQRVWKMTPSPTRKRDRAETYAGIAAAMADQWGSL